MSESLPVFVGKSWADHVKAWKAVTKEIEDRQWQLGAIADSLTRNYGESSIERFAGDVQCKPCPYRKSGPPLKFLYLQAILRNPARPLNYFSF